MTEYYMSRPVLVRHTGSALLDELVMRRREIQARMRGGSKQPRHSTVVRKPPDPTFVVTRIAEVRALLRTLPYYHVASFCGGAPYDELPIEPWPMIAIPGHPTIEEIQKLVASYFSVSRDGILSRQRNALVMLPRHIAIYLSRLLTRHTLAKISRIFHRDHTTAIYAVRKITGLVATDETLSEEIALLKQMLLE